MWTLRVFTDNVDAARRCFEEVRIVEMLNAAAALEDAEYEEWVAMGGRKGYKPCLQRTKLPSDATTVKISTNQYVCSSKILKYIPRHFETRFSPGERKGYLLYRGKCYAINPILLVCVGTDSQVISSNLSHYEKLLKKPAYAFDELWRKVIFFSVGRSIAFATCVPK